MAKKPNAPTLHAQTGPTTPGGKEASSRNSTSHGCRAAKHRILPGESEPEYRQLHRRWFAEYGPTNELDIALLERIVNAEWRMLRCERQLAETEAHIGLKPIHEWTDQDEKTMLRARRYHREAQRLYTASRRDLDSLRLTRHQEITAMVRAGTSLEKLPLRNPAEPALSQEHIIRPADLLARLEKQSVSPVEPTNPEQPQE